jgi:cephalosporin hydroxylase
MAGTLDEIGLRYGTDKSSSHHDYLSFYESFMAPLRNAPITLLEIGVYQGASLSTWREYFPNAKIIGVDINVNCKQFETGDIKIELADQSNVEHLARLAATHGPFDIVVEDGSHLWEHQVTSLRTLFPFVRNGGYYIAEDLQTNYGSLQANYRGVAAESCMDYLKKWLDLFVADESLDIAAVEDAFLRTYGRAAEFITFHRRACVIRKRFPPTDWRVSRGPPLAPEPADRLMVMISAHFGLRGDILGPRGYVDEGADVFTVQGLSMESEIAALEYRVRFPDGTWGDWVGEGGFAGTRGQSLPISGVCVRIAERLRDRFDLEIRGLFVGGVAVDVIGDEPCVAPSGAELRGLQVTIRPAQQALKPADGAL